ncbi:BON domain-containing protein [Paraburkholderia sp. CNPSo 3274]|uniref:BON domain-containing protein n=1 Tax=Paraburkholderia sp. CNPSo 3274 TaxID=2940932 RepID=UPI0020B89756|nr:BON domain-containing protein [Paraburkholderia sp. CNPSo 3274]MCP3713415.1 BON domain-containing protein [Paraburkholderia sp. CNPSo 3274]
MKRNWALGIAGGVLIASASVHVWAQAGASEASAASNGTAVAASGSTTAKDIRKADRALRRKVYSAIVTHREINAGNISVIAKGGAVTLDGTVVDASQIDKVSEIAKGVPGVTSVTNKLTVKKPFGGQ